MRCNFLLAAITFGMAATAQPVTYPAAAPYLSLTSYSIQNSDVFSFGTNAAALAGTKHFAIGLYSERRFLLQELSSHSLVAAAPVFAGAFGVKAGYYGSAAYNQTSLGFGYGRKLGEAVSVGAGFQYHRLAAAGYGSASVVGFDAGARFRVTEGVQAGVAVHNPVGMKFGKSGAEKLASVYTAGIGWDASPQLFISTELQKVEDQQLGINAGVQYVFAERLLARLGICSGASVYYIGFGLKLKGLRLDVGAAFHPSLGSTPGLALLYSAKP